MNSTSIARLCSTNLFLLICLNLASQPGMSVYSDIGKYTVSQGVFIKSATMGYYRSGKYKLETGFQTDLKNNNKHGFSGYTLNTSRSFMLKEIPLELKGFWTRTFPSQLLVETDRGLILKISQLHREIAVPSDDYFILSMGDSHVGGTDNLDSFFHVAKARNAVAVVLAGDLTTGHGKDWDIFEKHLPLPDSLSQFYLAGNHDLFFDGWKKFYSRFGSSSYLFTIKTPKATDLFLCLETAGGTLGDKQLDWLIDILETRRSGYRHCLVFTHNNFFRPRHTDSTNPAVEELQVLLELFAEHNVEMVITGHDHKQYSVEFGVTTYIVMDALKDGLSNAGYFQIRVRNSNIDYVFENFK